jgi:phospholipase/lecithinase/hemolysin
VGRIPFDQQIRNFQSTLDQLTNNLSADDVSRAIGRCIFFVGMGSNDYLNNYLMPNYPTRSQYNGEQFATLLVQRYTLQLTVRFFFHFIYLFQTWANYRIFTHNNNVQRLYNLGARKFVISGIGQMGCIPSILAQSPIGACSEEVNLLIQPFNANVKTMMSNLSANLPASTFTYVDVAHMFSDIATNARSYGIYIYIYFTLF